MNGSVKINIGGQLFQLKGENEQQLTDAANEVNIHIDNIRKKYKTELPQTTLLALSAMNLAESNNKLKKQIENDQRLMLSEMNRMIEVLENALGQEY